MKAINTKEMMTSFEAYKKAERSANFYKGLADRYPTDYDKALKELETAKVTLKDVTQVLTYALSNVQDRCRARTITEMEILEVLYKVQTGLGISKKAMNGITIVSDLNQQRFARAYNFTAQSTQFTAEFKNGVWEITDIYRATCRESDKDKLHINLTDDAKAEILKRVSYGIF